LLKVTGSRYGADSQAVCAWLHSGHSFASVWMFQPIVDHLHTVIPGRKIPRPSGRRAGECAFRSLDESAQCSERNGARLPAVTGRPKVALGSLTRLTTFPSHGVSTMEKIPFANIFKRKFFVTSVLYSFVASLAPFMLWTRNIPPGTAS